MSRPVEPEIARFVRRIHVNPETLCWEWEGAILRNGYSAFTSANNGGMVKGHRWSYRYWVGPIPEGLVLDHLCRVRHCVNPDHLEAVTNRTNIRRGDVGKEKRERTHCVNGHEFTETNTWINPRNGTRACKACNNTRQRATRLRRLARISDDSASI